jgi:single-stranded-DNA-specific exonuclease
MKYELINKPNLKYNAKQQILINRGLKETDLVHYMNLTDEDINDPSAFGEELMDTATKCLLNHLEKNSHIAVIVDCDCDGYTSAAILINYLSDLKDKEWIDNHVFWFMHEGKQHGLQDCTTWLEDIGPDLIIIPDAGSMINNSCKIWKIMI